MRKKLIVALDNIDLSRSIKLVKGVSDIIWGVKLRSLVLKHSLSIVEEFKQYCNVMLDFKLYDIQSAMEESIGLHLQYGADITTIHCSSMFIPKEYKNNVIGVTILSSMKQNDFNRFNKGTICKTVSEMVNFSDKYHGGIVCSPLELSGIDKPNLLKICPGVRPKEYINKDDQSRIDTPCSTIKNGADLIVIGRPIILAKDKVGTTKKIIESMNGDLC